MSDAFAAQYDPAALESTLYAAWRDAGLFHANADAAATPFVVMMPPPNVTAALHVGHGLNNTVQDVLVRFERMRSHADLFR